MTRGAFDCSVTVSWGELTSSKLKAMRKQVCRFLFQKPAPLSNLMRRTITPRFTLHTPLLRQRALSLIPCPLKSSFNHHRGSPRKSHRSESPKDTYRYIIAERGAGGKGCSGLVLSGQWSVISDQDAFSCCVIARSFQLGAWSSAGVIGCAEATEAKNKAWLTVAAKGSWRLDYYVIVSRGELRSSKLLAPSYDEAVKCVLITDH